MTEGSSSRQPEKRIVLLAGDGVGPEAARRAEPALREAFPSVEFVSSSFDPKENGDLQTFCRLHGFDGALLGPSAASAADPLADPALHHDGSAVAYVGPNSQGVPMWIVEPGRGGWRDLVEFEKLPSVLRRPFRAFSSRFHAVPAAVAALDRASVRAAARLARQTTGEKPVGLLWPGEAIGRRHAAEVLTKESVPFEELDLRQTAYCLAAGQDTALPAALVTSNAYGSVLAAALAARRGPATVATVQRSGTLLAARVGHGPLHALAGQDRVGPVGFLAAAAALMLLIGPETRAKRLLWVLAQWADDPRRRTPELGGEASPGGLASDLPQRLAMPHRPAAEPKALAASEGRL